jgi:hypothetical protein
MTALDFPDNPTAGQVFGRWVFDGSKWMLAGSSTIPAPPAVLFVSSTVGSMPTGQWLTQQWGNAPVVESGGWTKNPAGDGWIVPRDGLYSVSLGLGTDAATVARMILSIEGANSTGWLQEGNGQRESSTRVVRFKKGESITPFFYNRGATLDGWMTLSVAEIAAPVSVTNGEGGGGGKLIALKIVDQGNTDGIGGAWTRLNNMECVNVPLVAGRRYRLSAFGTFHIDAAANNGTGNISIVKGGDINTGQLSMNRSQLGMVTADPVRTLLTETFYVPVADEVVTFTTFAAFDCSPPGIFSHRPSGMKNPSYVSVEEWAP